jgi:DNA polymerase-3 subunit delta
MTPEQFLDRVSKKAPDSVYLFVGPESYNRERCRKALVDRALAGLSEEEREGALTRHDLDQVPLTSALDDARSLSLFATRRLIWLARAESALPRGKTVEAEEEGNAGGNAAALASYLRQPTPDTVVVFDCARFEFDGEDKARIERVQKFYAGVPAQVEFKPFSPEASRAHAQNLARSTKLQLGLAELALLLEATGGEASRIALEIEKLKLLAGDRKVTADDIAALVPDAQAATIFALVAALGRGDRGRALETLDTLSRYAAGADVSGHTIPHGVGGSRGGIAERRRNSGALQPLGSAHLAGEGSRNRADYGGVPQSSPGTRYREIVCGRPRPARRPAG